MDLLFRIFVFAVAALLLQAKAFAGSIQSGGGEVFNDKANPWFIQNTKTVRYCILIDDRNFGADVTQVKKQIVRALNYWQDEFRLARVPQLQPQQWTIVSQQYVETTCNSEHELTFQFGILSDAQRDFLKDPRDYVGVAVRESYDTKNLIGRGYIYISPAFGPFKIRGEKVAENPWTMGGGIILAQVIAHELGHVYGLPHNGNFLELMSPLFPEMAVGEMAKFSSESDGIPKSLSLFAGVPLDSAKGRCIGIPEFGKVGPFFGAPQNWRCIRIQFDHESIVGKSLLKVYAAAQASDQEQLISSAELSDSEFDGLTAGAYLFVNQDQNIFKVPFQKGLTIDGPRYPRVTKKGTLNCHLRHCERDVVVRFDALMARIGGVIDGKLYTDLFSKSSP